MLLKLALGSFNDGEIAIKSMAREEVVPLSIASTSFSFLHSFIPPFFKSRYLDWYQDYLCAAKIS